MTLLYAIGAGVLVNVAVDVLGRFLRLANVRFDVSGSPVVVGVAAAVIVAALGLRARRELIRLALLGLAALAALVINRFLGVTFVGRAPDDGSVDAFAGVPAALVSIVGAVVLGIAVGLIARGFQVRVPWRPPERLVRVAGFAFVAGTLASLFWPAPFLGQVLAATDLMTVALSLPLVLAGPLAGGAYASRIGVDYRGVVTLGVYITLPLIVPLVVGTVADVGRLSDPRFDRVAGELRGRIVLSWFLVAIRLGGWPLGSAFAQGFLTTETSIRQEHAP